jgi:hypothetical protein
MTQAEKNNILDQHKTIYDGFATQYGQPKEQPLYIQDFANDKGGITLNNKGEIKSYTNMRINENVFTGSMGTPEQTFDFGGPDGTFDDEEFMVSVGEQLDMIGDGSDDLDHGTFEDDETEMLVSPEGDIELFMDNEDDDDTMIGHFFDDEDMESEWDEPKFKGIDLSKSDDIDMDEIEPLQEQLNKTLDMFKRFNNY